MPTSQAVTLRLTSLQYDGTNSADILALVGLHRGVAVYSIGSETGGVLTLTPNPGYSGWNDPIVVNDDDHVVEPYGGVCPDATFVDRFVVLP